jgi:hypothetical protein
MSVSNLKNIDYWLEMIIYFYKPVLQAVRILAAGHWPPIGFRCQCSGVRITNLMKWGLSDSALRHLFADPPPAEHPTPET